MIVTEIASEIFARLQAYELVSHYGFAEIVPDGESSIPAVYCSNGEYKHVINDYDWSEGIAYIRYNGTEITTFSDAEFIGCQDLLNIVFPTRLVIIGKRKGQTPYEVASLIRSRITGMYENIAQAYGAVYVDVTSSAIQHDIRTNLNTEFDGADVAWDTANYIISIDLNIEVLIDANCNLDAGNIPPSMRSMPPNIIPNGGSFAFDATIQLTHPNPSADIYYTLDGTTPTIDQGILYTGQFTIFQNTLVSARAFINGELPSFVSTAGFNISGVGVVILPQSGEYLENALITLLSETGTGTIYYTLNNTEPTTSSAVYSSPILITENAIVKAIVVDPPRATAPSSSATFGIKLLPPVSDTAAGIYLTQKVVNLTAVGVVEWRVDGGILNESNTIIVSESGFYEFRDTAPNNVSSDFIGVLIEIQCAAPTISPSSAFFTGSQLVTITTNEPSGATYYTTNGSEPTESSTLYTAPFTVTQTTTIKAKTFRANTIPSVTITAQMDLEVNVWMVGMDRSFVFASRWFRSLNTGASWVNLLSSLSFQTTSRPGALATNAAGTVQVWSQIVGLSNNGENRSRRTINSGVSYTDLNYPIPADPNFNNRRVQAVKMSASGQYWFVNGFIESGKSDLWVSDDFGATFTKILINGQDVPSGIPFTDTLGVIFNYFIAASGDNTILMTNLRISIDAGVTWTSLGSNNIRSVAVSQDGQFAYYSILSIANATTQFFRSDNGGVTFTEVTGTGIVYGGLANFDISDSGQYVYLNSGQRLYKSSDYGLTFELLDPLGDNSNYGWRGIKCGRNGKNLLAYTLFTISINGVQRGRLYFSTNFGNNWTETQPFDSDEQGWCSLALS